MVEVSHCDSSIALGGAFTAHGATKGFCIIIERAKGRRDSGEDFIVSGRIVSSII